MNLKGKRLVIGMTGGIAAYKVCELVRRLQDEGATVRVVMTRSAQEFVSATTMQALSGQPVATDQWGVEGARAANAMPHIDLSREADALLIAPCTANFIAKLAHGLADDLLSTLALARRTSPPCPLLVAPAANGFLAQTFRSPKLHPWLIPAGLALPFSRKMARRLLGKVINDDGVALSVDVTQWHRYRLDWSLKRVSFQVDDAQVFESVASPNPPLGLVIWIDNQYAAFTPEGRIAMGVLEGQDEWLENKDLEINSP